MRRLRQGGAAIARHAAGGYHPGEPDRGADAAVRPAGKADLAALLQIRESTLLSGCGRIAIEEGDPCQLLLVQAAPGKAETATAALQKRLETVRQAFSGSPAAQSGQVITAGDYALLIITPAGDAAAVRQEVAGFFTGAE